jgi:O-Antigen ligase
MRPGRMRLSEEAPAAPVASWAVGIWLAWAWLGGGHAPDRWGLLGAILIAAVALGTATLPVSAGRVSGAGLVLLLALLAFVTWNFLSLLWADFPGDAWTGADKALLYAATFIAFWLWAWTPRALAALLALFTLGIALIGVAVVVKVSLAADPAGLFNDNRLDAPIGYVDGNAALWTIALWPAVFLGSTGALGGMARPIFLAAATFLLELAITIQSRGWLAASVAAACVFVLLGRQRLRLTLGLALCVAGALSILRPLLDVYERGRAGVPIRGPFDHAARLMLVSSLGVAIAGAVWTVVDRRWQPSKRLVRRASILAAAGLLSALAVTGAWAATTADHPGRWISDRWDEFTCPYCPNSERTRSRFTASVSGDRYREWSVAWEQFERHPLIGVGSDNYAAPYLQERTDPLFEPKYPHSTPLRLLSQLGLVGTLLFSVAAVLAVAFALRRRRLLDLVGGGAVGAALAVFAYWLIHGSIDWFWEIPALAAPAFGALGAAAAVEPTPLARDRAGPRLPVLAAVGAGGVAALLVALPGLSYSFVQSSSAFARDNPHRAYSRLDVAAALNPLSAEAPLAAGSIALRRHDWPKATSSLAEAASREPKNWYVYVQLALLADNEGRYRGGAAEIRRARELNPQDPGAALLERAIARRLRVEPATLGNLYLQRIVRRFR